tara:strand:+ start:10687 stop:11946 length:1260 start_codon:yes stop_codon:yes gene_type:complete
MTKANSNYKIINKCRLCGSEQLSKIIDFNCSPLGNNLQKTNKLAKNATSFDLVVMNCIDCNHFQLNSAVSPELLYATNYTYLSGVGLSFVNHIKDYVDWILKKTKLHEKCTVIDIGSNDGTCLKYFQKKGHNVCGVDPALKPSKIAISDGIPTINNFFNKKVVIELLSKYGKVDIVTSQNALAHVDDLKSTFENIHYLLKDKGYFVFEVGYFKRVIELMQFDTIYHEHIDYHHAGPLVRFLTNLGFNVIEINENKIQGGSIRFLLQKSNKNFVNKKVNNFLISEKNSILYNHTKLVLWEHNIKLKMKNLKDLYLTLKQDKEFSFAYGAPTKATLLLKIADLSKNDIEFIVDDNKLKIGRYMPQTGIKIVSSNRIKFNKSAIILLLAWNFADDIIINLKKKYKVSATIIVPFPSLRVIEI